MKIDFVRFKATDGVELQGWYSEGDNDIVVIHIHGMSGNGYENYFLDAQRKAYAHAGAALFTFDNRGRGVISQFRQGDKTKLAGSCFEIFEESAFDIQGAIDFVKTKDKAKFVLQGHSLGASKIIDYLVNSKDEEVVGVVLLAPTDMVGWAGTDPKNQEYLDKAHKLIADDKPEELVGVQCWWDKTPISAQTYPSICEKGTAVDMYASRRDGSLLSKMQVPMTMIYGDQDIGILDVDGSVEEWKKRTSGVINRQTSIQIIPGASHGFAGFENELAEKSAKFVEALK